MNNISKENIVETRQYKQGVKKLIKKHKTETLNSLKQIIEDLCNFKITTQYHNHKLTNLDAYELHVNNEGDVLLIYRYSGSALIISLHLIDLTDHKELKNPDYKKQIKKTIKNLKENKGDKNMEYMEYITTNENTLIVGFKFKNKITGADTMFNYEVPFEVFIEAVKDYFDKHFDVVLDGKDKDIWNMLVDLGERVNADIIQEFIEDDEIIKELQDRLEEEAHEKFDEMCEEEVKDEEEFEDDELEESYSSSSLFESVVKKLRKEGYIVDVAEKINQVYQTYCYQMASARKRTPEDDPNYTGKMVEDDSYLDEQGLFGVFDHYDEVIDDIHGTEICVGEELFPADSRTVSGICREIKENIE